jgi:hypothetical protein
MAAHTAELLYAACVRPEHSGYCCWSCKLCFGRVDVDDPVIMFQTRSLSIACIVQAVAVLTATGHHVVQMRSCQAQQVPSTQPGTFNAVVASQASGVLAFPEVSMMVMAGFTHDSNTWHSLVAARRTVNVHAVSHLSAHNRPRVTAQHIGSGTA